MIDAAGDDEAGWSDLEDLGDWHLGLAGSVADVLHEDAAGRGVCGQGGLLVTQIGQAAEGGGPPSA